MRRSVSTSPNGIRYGDCGRPAAVGARTFSANVRSSPTATRNGQSRGRAPLIVKRERELAAADADHRAWATWIRVALSFLAATGVQLLLYGVPARLAAGHDWLRDALYTPYALFWMVGPAFCAATYSVRLLKRRALESGRSIPGVSSLVLVVALTVLSAYAGMFICVNTWGT